jgi:quercetin dioxygenase-like cupin family protein
VLNTFHLTHHNQTKLMVRISLIILTFLITASVTAQNKPVNVLLQKNFDDLPDREGVMLTVDFPPGSSSPKHRHNAHTFVYVLEGSVIMQVEGGEQVTLTAGGTFYETPDDIHVVSKNASMTEPAKALVFFVKRQGAPMTVPVP